MVLAMLKFVIVLPIRGVYLRDVVHMSLELRFERMCYVYFMI